MGVQSKDWSGRRGQAGIGAAALLASTALCWPEPARAACITTPSSNQTFSCSGASTTGIIAPASTGVNFTLLTGGSIIPPSGASIALGATANINLQTSTIVGSTAITNTYAVQVGDSSQVTISGTLNGQGGVSGPGGAGFSNATIDLTSTGLILTAGTGSNAGLKGTGGGNTYQIDGFIHATGTSGDGIQVGNNDNVTLGATGQITSEAGDTARAINGFGATNVQVTTAAGSAITVNGLGFTGAIALGTGANVQVGGTVNSTGSGVPANSVILGGIAVNANSSVWVKQGGQVLVATNPANVTGLSAAPAIQSSSGTLITNSTIKVDGIVENHLGNGINGSTGDNITIGSTGRVSVLGGGRFTNTISINGNTSTTANQVTIDIAGRVENLAGGSGIFLIGNDKAAGETVVTPIHANVTIEQTGVLAVQNNVAYGQFDGAGGAFPAVNDNLVIKGTVSRSTPGTVIDLNDGNDTLTIFPTAKITGNINDGPNTSGPSNNAFIFDGAAGTTGTFDFNANVTTGFDAFTKQGAGTWIVSGNVSFSTTASINAGALYVNGTFTVPQTTVAVGATLGGSGTIVGAVTINGNIAPGNSIGTLNITGPYTQATGSTYTVEINNAGQGDLIAVTGAATIQAGATVVVVGAPGFYTLGQRYTILTATGGVTGQYATLTDNLPFVDFTLGKTANSIFFDVTRSTVAFTQIAQTPNQIAAASGAQTLGTGNKIFDSVVMLDVPNARRAFDLLSGEIHATVSGTLLEDSRFIRDAVSGRLRQSMGEPASIFAPQLATLNFGEEDNDIEALGYGPVKRKRVRDTMDGALPVKAAPYYSGPVYTAWGQAFGNFGRTDGDGNAASLNRTTGGFITGMDATTRGKIGDVWRAGLAFGYQHTSVDVSDRNSSGGVNTYYLAAYGGRQVGAFGVRAGASYGWHDISTSRSIVFPGFSDSSKGRYNANTAQVFGEVGYSMMWRQFAIEPFAGIAYVNLRTDSFVEAGGAAALVGTGGTTDTSYSTIGLRAAAPLPWRDLAGLVARSSIGWRHTLGTVNPTAPLSFASGGTPFVVSGTPIARDAAAVELGLEGRLWRNATLGIAYTGQIAGNADDHGVNANFVQKF